MPRISETRESLSSTFARIGLVDVRAYGATGDGTTDDRAAIQAADAAAALIGARIYIPRSATPYRLSKSGAGNYALMITCAGVVGDGPGASILKLLDSAPDSTAIMRGDNLTGATFENFGLDGNLERGLATAGSENEGLNLKSPVRCTVRNVHAWSCAQDGIDLDDATLCVVDGCVIRDCWGGGIHIAGTGSQADRVVISNCHTYGCGQERKVAALTYYSGISIVGDDCVIAGCTSNGDQRGIEANGQGHSIVGCVIRDAGSASTGDYSISLNACSRTGVTGCTITQKAHASSAGIVVDGASIGNTITGCDVYSGQNAVLLTTGQGDTLVSSCSAHDALGAGFRVAAVASGKRWVFQGCLSTGGVHGFWIEAANGTVSGCEARGGSGAGIDLRTASTTGVTVVSNVTSGTAYGIRCNSSPTNCKIIGNDADVLTTSGTGHIVQSNIIAGVWTP